MNRSDMNGHEALPRARGGGNRQAGGQQRSLLANGWSRQFILSVLESFTPLARGQGYARSGQVLDLEIRPGLVYAKVQGSRSAPYGVEIRIPVFQEDEWAAIEMAMAARTGVIGRLRAGILPEDLETVFREVNLSLFPAGFQDVETTCSCPDLTNPCRHVAATYYMLSDAFARDPFLLLRWRGRDREQLLERLALVPEPATVDAAAPGPLPEEPPALRFSGEQADFYELVLDHCRTDVEQMNQTIQAEWQQLTEKAKRVQELILALEYRKQVAGQIYASASILLGLENDLDVSAAIQE